MADGRTHESFNLVGLAGLGLLGLGTQGPSLFLTPEAQAFALGYLLGTFYLSPDLDLAEGSRAGKRFGPLAILWRPYAWLFPHRGVSHSWFIGPLTRLLYLGVLLSPLLLLGVKPPSLPREVLLPGLLVYYLSQWFHLFLDGVPPFSRLGRRWRRWRV